MHPSEEQLQTLTDGELSDDDSERVLTHVEQCERCKARRRAMELTLQEAGELLESLDRETPPVSPEDVIRMAERRNIPWRRGSRRALWAASIAGLITAGIVVAAVVPGSPIREVLERIVTGPEPEAPAEGRETDDLWKQEAGIALVADGSLEIVFQETQVQGAIELVIAGGDTARVEVRSDSVGFVVGSGAVVVENRGAQASYRISLPADLPAALIRVGDRTLYKRVGSDVLQDEFQREGEARRIPFSAIPR